MASPKFPYTTYIDRVITDENHDIIFGEKSGNVYDKINDVNQQEINKNLQTQITNQQKQINRQDTQIENQETQIERLETQISNQETMIDVLNDVVTQLVNMVDIGTDQIDNQEEMIVNQETMITRQQEIKDRLDEQFDVIINGNKMEVYGVSTDDKPTDVKIGTTFFETDTTKAFIYSGVSWVEL